MNNDRRKAIKALYPDVEAIKPLLEAYKAAKEALEPLIVDLHNDIESIKEEEQEYLDNMAENLKQGEKAQTAESAIEALEGAMEIVEPEDINYDELDLDDLVGKLDEATA